VPYPFTIRPSLDRLFPIFKTRPFSIFKAPPSRPPTHLFRLFFSILIVGWEKPVANWAKRTKPQAGARERTVPWRTSGKMHSRLLGQCGAIAPERGIISYSLSPIVPPIFFITQETTIFPPPRVLHCPPTTPCRPQGALIAIWDISAATISHGKGSGNSPQHLPQRNQVTGIV